MAHYLINYKITEILHSIYRQNIRRYIVLPHRDSKRRIAEICDTAQDTHLYMVRGPSTSNIIR